MNNNEHALPISILISSIILAGAWVTARRDQPAKDVMGDRSAFLREKNNKLRTALEEQVLPFDGVILPVSWGDLGAKLTSVGAIDAKNLRAIYEKQNTFSKDYEKLLSGNSYDNLKISEKNAGYLLNLFWALGLASKNAILDEGEMADSAYGGPQDFASTAGWTIALGEPMSHYSRHKFFELTDGQQALVNKVSKGIYRPCCSNSTHFPDCNHGMAMLGLLELMAFQGASEDEMWRAALSVNSYWFPDAYMTMAVYMKNKGIDWKDVDAREMLGKNYSSSVGFRKLASQVLEYKDRQGGGGCGIDAGEASRVQRGQSGCGI